MAKKQAGQRWTPGPTDRERLSMARLDNNLPTDPRRYPGCENGSVFPGAAMGRHEGDAAFVKPREISPHADGA